MIATARAGGSTPLTRSSLLHAGALDEAHVDVEHAVDLAEVVHGDDVRLLQSGGDAGLAPESIPVGRVGGDVGPQQLQRDHAFPDGVEGAVDLAHATDADQLLQFVGPEVRAQS